MNSQIIEAKAVDAPTNNTVEVVDKKKKVMRNIKISLFILLVIAIIGLGIWLVSAVKVYKAAKVYKISHDIVQQELDYCDQIVNEKQEKKVFDYCDEIKNKFKSVERE